jgi:hypothetical protein
MLSLGLISAGTGVRLQAQTAPPASAPTQVPPQVAGDGSANGRRGDSATDEQRNGLNRVREELTELYRENRKNAVRLAVATGQTAVLSTAPTWPSVFQLNREEAEAELAAEKELKEFLDAENSALEDLVKLEELPGKPPTAEQEKPNCATGYGCCSSFAPNMRRTSRRGARNWKRRPSWSSPGRRRWSRIWPG